MQEYLNYAQSVPGAAPGIEHDEVEAYGGEDSEFMARLFIVTHALQIQEARLQHEQVSIFLGHKTVITFQENHSTEWDPIRQRDLYDHIVQIIDLIETYRGIASDLIETYMSSVSNRMNEIMKVLTLAPNPRFSRRRQARIVQ